MKNGRLNSDELVNNVIEEYLDKYNQWDNLLFDGYPRTLEQWSALHTLLTSRDKKIDAAIYLDISESECASRIETRVLSKSTGRIFNTRTVPPPTDWPQEDLYSRNDGSEETLATRFQIFNQITKKLVDEYFKFGILVQVDAFDTIANIHDQIVVKLKERNLVE